MTTATLRAVKGALIPAGRPGMFLGWERVREPEQAEHTMPLPAGGEVHFRRVPYFTAELTGEVLLAVRRGELEHVDVKTADSEPVTRTTKRNASKE